MMNKIFSTAATAAVAAIALTPMSTGTATTVGTGTATTVQPTPGLALPNPEQRGTLSVTRQYSDGSPAQDIVEVVVCHLTHDKNGQGLDLTTQAGWDRAGDLTLEEALELSCAQTWTLSTTGGVAVFEDLPLGLFRVSSLYTSYGPEGTNASTPFLVTLPTTNQAGDGWVYTVGVYPKGQDPLANIGGVVWYDQAQDGRHGDDDEPREGVRVRLYRGDPQNGSGTIFAVTYTNKEGRWEFTGLPIEIMTVRYDITPLNGPQTTSYSFTIYGLDSHANPETGWTTPVQLIARDWVHKDAGIISNPTPTPTPTTPTTPTPEPTPTHPTPTPTPGPGLPVTGVAITAATITALTTITIGLYLRFNTAKHQNNNNNGNDND